MKDFIKRTVGIMIALTIVSGIISCADNSRDGNAANHIGEAVKDDFVKVEAGTFQMGSNEGNEFNKPVHNVTISKAYYMSVHEVTQAKYNAVMGDNPSKYKTDAVADETQENRPVECVSWYMAIVYCNKLSAAKNLKPCYTISGSTDPAAWGAIPTLIDSTWETVKCDFTADGYRLPTEAEWEYAARAGDTSVNELTWSGTKIESSLRDYAWYRDSAKAKTHEVKKKTANKWGLYDMSGNVYEWCWDRYSAYASEAQTEPTGGASNSNRISRGGCFFNNSSYCAVSYRDFISPNFQDKSIGFRVCRSGSN